MNYRSLILFMILYKSKIRRSKKIIYESRSQRSGGRRPCGAAARARATARPARRTLAACTQSLSRHTSDPGARARWHSLRLHCSRVRVNFFSYFFFFFSVFVFFYVARFNFSIGRQHLSTGGDVHAPHRPLLAPGFNTHIFKYKIYNPMISLSPYISEGNGAVGSRTGFVLLKSYFCPNCHFFFFFF
jgi:hypothetical protein